MSLVEDKRIQWPAAARNREPILAVLRDVLPERGLVLEVGCGPGEHAAYFASRLPGLEWQPTDREPPVESILAWREHLRAENVRDPRAFDLFEDEAPVAAADAIVCINTIHIAPWAATRRLFEHAARLLGPRSEKTKRGAPLFLYGPFRFRDRPLEPSNEEFDQSIRARIPGAGLRVFEDIDEIARELGFEFCEDRPMPANNHALWWRRATG